MTDSTDDVSIFAGIYESYLEEIELLQKKINKNSKKELWETKDGQKIRFVDLMESHKKNIIKWADRNGIELPKFFEEVKYGK